MSRIGGEAALPLPNRATSLRPLSLESRISLLRRRRRLNVLRQLVAVIGPVLLVGSILLLIAAGGVFASAR